MIDQFTDVSAPAPFTPFHGLKQRLLRGTAATLVLRVLAVGFGYGCTILFARLLGVHEYGAYVFLMSWVSLFGALGVFGLDRLLIRQVASYITQSAWGPLHGLVRWSLAVVALTSLLMLGIAAGLWPSSRHLLRLLPLGVAAIALLIPLTMLLRLQQSVLLGLQRAANSQLLDTLGYPLRAVFMLALYWLCGQGGRTASHGVFATMLGVAVIFCYAEWLVCNGLPAAYRTHSPVYLQRAWLLSAVPLFFTCGLDMINNQVGTLLLGAMQGTKAAGIFAVSVKGSQLITFVLVVANMALAPVFASLYVSGEHVRLQELVTRSVRLITLATLPVAAGIILFGHWFLLAFGTGFSGGHAALVALGIGQFINVAMGSVGYLLIMTGHERDAAVGMGISTALNVLLNILLIPRWGVMGAAIATATGIALWNIILAWFVWKRLGIHATALGAPGRVMRDDG